MNTFEDSVDVVHETQIWLCEFKTGSKIGNVLPLIIQANDVEITLLYQNIFFSQLISIADIGNVKDEMIRQH